jgi:hypothetical protein
MVIRERGQERWAELPVTARAGALAVRLSPEDAAAVADRRWYWHCRRGVYERAEGRLLTRWLLPDLSRVVHLNGDRLDCRRENLAAADGRFWSAVRARAAMDRAGVWWDARAGRYLVRVQRERVRVALMARDMESARRVRRRLMAMSHAELMAWSGRKAMKQMTEEEMWLGEDVAPLIAERVNYDAEAAAAKGYEAGWRAAQVLKARNAESLTELYGNDG